MDNVEFLGFDVFGTIVDWRTGVARAVAAFSNANRLELDAFVFADNWRALYQPAMEEVRSGRRRWVKLETLNRENLEIVLRDVGLEPSTFNRNELDELNNAWQRLDPWPDAVAGLTRLKKRFKIAPISNGSISGMTELARFGGLPWDLILGSEISKTFKPQLETYRGSIAVAGEAPETSAMVAAHNDDLTAARQLGMATIFIQRKTEHGPGQTSDIEAMEPWDVVAENLLGAADILGC